MVDFTLPENSPLNADNVMGMILRHYWMREIGMETVALWHYALNTRLQEIMPKYSEIAAAQLEIHSIYDGISETEEWGINNTRDYQRIENGERHADISGHNDGTQSGAETETGSGTSSSNNSGETHTTGTTTGTSSGESGGTEKTTDSSETTSTHVMNGTDSNTGSNQKMLSDTPQNGLQDVIAGRYLTQAQVDSSTASGENHQDSSDSTTGKTDSNVTRTGTDSQNTSGTSKTDGTETGEQTGTASSSSDTKTNMTSSSDDSRTESHTSSNGIADTEGKEETGRRTKKYTNGSQYDTLVSFTDRYINIYQMIIGDVADLFISIL